MDTVPLLAAMDYAACQHMTTVHVYCSCCMYDMFQTCILRVTSFLITVDMCALSDSIVLVWEVCLAERASMHWGVCRCPGRCAHMLKDVYMCW